jgi:hypothetical protein
VHRHSARLGGSRWARVGSNQRPPACEASDRTGATNDRAYNEWLESDEDEDHPEFASDVDLERGREETEMRAEYGLLDDDEAFAIQDFSQDFSDEGGQG